MTAKGNLSRMTLDLPEEDHKRLKALAAILGKIMREIVSNWIHEQSVQRQFAQQGNLASY